jgi:hypothetical protein
MIVLQGLAMGGIGDCESIQCRTAVEAFAELKEAAIRAGWPADLSPGVVSIDQQLQRLIRQSDPDAGYLASIITQAEEMTLRLRARMAPKAPVAARPALVTPQRAPAPVPQPMPPVPIPSPPSTWKYVAAGVGAIAVVVGVVSALAGRRASRPVMAGSARRRRWSR